MVIYFGFCSHIGVPEKITVKSENLVCDFLTKNSHKIY